MKKLKHNENGFFTMLLVAVIVVGGIVYLAFVRVHHAQVTVPSSVTKNLK